MQTANPQHCPLCDSDNRCAVAAGKAPSDCWCMTTEISDSAKQAAARLGDRQRCICPRCANPVMTYSP